MSEVANLMLASIDAQIEAFEQARKIERTRFEWNVGMAVMPGRVVSRHNTVKDRLLAGDPDWQEFKQRWAAEHGPIGDEDAAPR